MLTHGEISAVNAAIPDVIESIMTTTAAEHTPLPAYRTAIGQRMYDRDSPYRRVHLSIETHYGSPRGELHQFSARYAGFNYLQAAYPAAAGLVAVAEGILQRVQAECDVDTIGAR